MEAISHRLDSRKLNLNCCLFLFRIEKRPGGGLRPAGEQWSGESTRHGGFHVEEAHVDVTIGQEQAPTTAVKKDRPVWMAQSTIITQDPMETKVMRQRAVGNNVTSPYAYQEGVEEREALRLGTKKEELQLYEFQLSPIHPPFFHSYHSVCLC